MEVYHELILNFQSLSKVVPIPSFLGLPLKKICKCSFDLGCIVQPTPQPLSSVVRRQCTPPSISKCCTLSQRNQAGEVRCRNCWHASYRFVRKHRRERQVNLLECLQVFGFPSVLHLVILPANLLALTLAPNNLAVTVAEDELVKVEWAVALHTAQDGPQRRSPTVVSLQVVVYGNKVEPGRRRVGSQMLVNWGWSRFRLGCIHLGAIGAAQMAP